ncbi:MAG: hypothetical protein ACC655_09280 [Rhodothermia bacterium]
MGQYAYILVASLAIVGGTVMFSIRGDSADAGGAVGRYQIRIEARDAAMTGLNLTLRKLAGDVRKWTNGADYQYAETPYDRATFRTTVTIVDPFSGDTADVLAVGTKSMITRDGRGLDTVYTIEARVARAYNEAAIPPGFKLAILSDENLRIHGDFQINAIYEGINADVHSNGTLRTNGNSFLVEGYGSGTTGIDSGQPDLFQPEVDWNGAGANVIERDSVPVPILDMDALRAAATVRELGNYVIAGSSFPYATFGEWAAAVGAPPGTGTTAKNPFVFVAEGSLEFQDVVTLGGFGILASGGDLRIHEGVHGEYSGFQTQMAIFTNGNATINGGASITATVYVAGRTKFNGNASMIGGFIGQESVKFGGTFDLTWVGPGPTLVADYFGPIQEPIGPVIIAYAEW